MKKYVMVFALCALLLGASGLQALHFARWNTSLGDFTAEIYEQLVPITGNNFIDLANSGFYNDLIFHRVVEGFVIQDGCPNGTGYGGPGYTIPLEIYPGFHHDQAGILAMARGADPNSAGSQYYITLAPAPHLDGNYAIFGKVVQGLDVVLDIGSVPVDASDHPLTPVEIDTLRILDLAIGNVTPPDSLTLVCDVNQPQMFIIEAFSDQFAIDYEWFVDGVAQAGGDFIFETSFAQAGGHSVACEVSNAEWSHEIVWDVLAEGSPAYDEEIPLAPASLEISPNPFR
ncbi:MAG: peptidylprolyl isomerase, partial [Candidatus Syntrophosphaera sp.]